MENGTSGVEGLSPSRGEEPDPGRRHAEEQRPFSGLCWGKGSLTWGFSSAVTPDGITPVPSDGRRFVIPPLWSENEIGR